MITEGSVWIDTQAVVPGTVKRDSGPDDVLRRTVAVTFVRDDGRVYAIGRWQRKTAARWRTVLRRRTQCEAGDFGAGRRFQPLTDDAK